MSRSSVEQHTQQGLDRYWRSVVLLTLLVVFVGIGSSALRELWGLAESAGS